MAPGFQAEDNVLFLYYCVIHSIGAGKIEWNAVAVATGSTKGAVEKRWSRIKKKIESEASSGPTATANGGGAPQPASTNKDNKSGGSRKRKANDVDDEGDADTAGPPQVDGQADRPSPIRRQTRGKQLNYNIGAYFSKNGSSSAITSLDSDDDSDYMFDAKAIKSEYEDLFEFEPEEDVKPKVKRIKKTQPRADQDRVTPAPLDGRRLYLGNLPYGVTEAELKQFFSGYTVESVTILSNECQTGANGYAFVNLTSPFAAVKAVRSLSGKSIHECKISVQLARNVDEAADEAAAAEAPYVLKRGNTIIKKAQRPTGEEEVPSKIPVVSKANMESNMHPSQKPLPSIEFSPPPTPVTTRSAKKQQRVTGTDRDINVKSLKPGTLINFPAKHQPQIMSNGVHRPRTNQQRSFSPISITSSLSATTDSAGRMVKANLAEHIEQIEIRPEDSISNIAARAQEVAPTTPATPTGVVSNTFRFFRGLLTPQA